MAIYPLTLLIMSITGVILGAFVYFNGRHKAQNISLAAYNIVFSLWCFFQFMGEIAIDKENVLFWTRLNLSAAIFIPVIFLNFIYDFLQKSEEKKNNLKFFYAVSFLLLVFIPTSYFIKGLSSNAHFKYYPQGGFVYAIFAAAFIVQIGLGFYELMRAYLISKGSRKNQTAYILLASSVGFGGGVLWFLPAFGFDIYPFGIYIVPFYAFIAAYAIIKHRLLDIRIAIKKSIVYTILVGLFSGIYLVFLLLVWKMFRFTTGLNSLYPAVAVLFCFAFLFDPARNTVQKAVDRVFSRGKYDYQKTLKDLSFSVMSAVKTQDFARSAVEAITKAINVSDIALYLYDSKNAEYVLRNSRGFEKDAANVIPKNHPLAALKNSVICEEAKDENLKEYCGRKNISLIIAMVINGSLIGFVCLGKKISDDMWNEEDINLLTTFSHHAAVAAENAMLCEDVMQGQFMLYQAEKLATIGTIAASMAHEIKNPLTAMKGLVQVLPQNINDREFIESFEDIIPRQIDRIDDTVGKLLKLARGGSGGAVESGKTTEIEIEEIVDDILLLLKIQCEKNGIKIIRKIKESLRVYAEKEQITQVLLNIILNAVQAMEDGGVLTVEIDKGQIQISDTGHGISAENINKIFDPFFSTKPNGAGLGLCIANRIIKDIGAKLDIMSSVGGGSTFKIVFNNSKRK